MNPFATGSRAAGRRKFANRAFELACMAATWCCVLILAVLLVSILYRGASWLNWNFLTSFPSRFPEKAGVGAAIAGSLWLMALTTLFVVPIGIASAVYLEEYANKKSWINSFVQINIANLAGVPSIVYGILGLGLFVRFFAMGRSILAASLTMSLVILPIVIISAQESLRAVPNSLRNASLALGATRWQTIWRQVLPVAMPGVLTGVILALSRAIGEAAPLMLIGALTYLAFIPKTPLDAFTALPIQIYNWSSRPQQEFRNVAAAGIVVLLVILLLMNATAVWLRHRSARRLGR